MTVKLLHYTPLEVADIAICKCYGNKPHEDLAKVQKRIHNVANVSKHASTIEHISYSFDIDGISRALLQELARHRHQNLTVKSTRYTLKSLKDEVDLNQLFKKSYFSLVGDDHNLDAYPEAKEVFTKYLVYTGNFYVDTNSMLALINLQKSLQKGISNDIAKYSLPESFKTSLVSTWNARSLQNFLTLRTSSHALLEIQHLAKAMYDVIPEDHKFLFDACVEGKL